MTQNEVVIKLPRPYDAQHQILREAKRFNVLCNGRRWGKTTLSIRLCKPALSKNYKIGYWSPTYKDLEEVWNEIKHRFHDAIQAKNEQVKSIRLYGGGLIDFWSMEDPNSGRGRSYHRAILDEFEKAKKGKEAWENTIRPTLTDYRGDGWFLSTPKGNNSYFHKLFENYLTYDNWMSWQMPTSTNPYIDPDEIEEARSQYDPVIFAQEYEAKFISHADKPWAYAFSEDHISEDIELKPRQAVYLSFDFNISPMTCTAHQYQGLDYYYTLYEFRSNNTGTEELCRMILGSEIGDCHFIVTGDATGRNRSAIGGNINNYQIIKQVLRISSGQIKVPVKNPALQESRALTNSILSRHPNRKIHKRCKHLIEDLRYVEANDKDKPVVNDKAMGHLLDGMRYMDNTFFHKFVKQSAHLNQ